MSEALPRIEAARLDGSESFHTRGKAQGFDVLEFWSWSTSDLVSNATRGALAEFIVGKALDAVVGDCVRNEWDAHDLTMKDGTRVEVKCSAFIQSWHQDEYTPPKYSTKPTRSWSASSGKMEEAPTRTADVYVFALLAHKEQESLDPLDLDQWQFFVLPTRVLDERKRSQHSITLPSLRRLAEGPVSFHALRSAVTKAASANGARRRD